MLWDWIYFVICSIVYRFSDINSPRPEQLQIPFLNECISSDYSLLQFCSVQKWHDKKTLTYCLHVRTCIHNLNICILRQNGTKTQILSQKCTLMVGNCMLKTTWEALMMVCPKTATPLCRCCNVQGFLSTRRNQDLSHCQTRQWTHEQRLNLWIINLITLTVERWWTKTILWGRECHYTCSKLMWLLCTRNL